MLAYFQNSTNPWVLNSSYQKEDETLLVQMIYSDYIPAIGLLHQNVAFLLCHPTGWKLQRKTKKLSNLTKTHLVIKWKEQFKYLKSVVSHFVDSYYKPK